MKEKKNWMRKRNNDIGCREGGRGRGRKYTRPKKARKIRYLTGKTMGEGERTNVREMTKQYDKHIPAIKYNVTMKRGGLVCEKRERGRNRGVRGR